MGDDKKGLVSVAPGVWIDPILRHDLDTRSAYVLLDEHGLCRLGLGLGQMKMLERLDHAGLIEIYTVTPRRKLLKLTSWDVHLARVRRDPDFWEKPMIKAKWKLARMAV